MMHSRSGRLARWCRRIWRGFQPVEFGNISWHQPAPFTFRKSLVTMQYSVLTRRWISAAIIAIVSAQLVACANRPSASVLDPVAVNPASSRQLTVLTATNRSRDGDGYSSRRNADPAFETFTVAIPPSHRPPKIEWPVGRPDASTDMVVSERRSLDQKQFLALADAPNKDGAVGIFVHGITIRSRRVCTGSRRSPPIPRRMENRSFSPGRRRDPLPDISRIVTRPWLRVTPWSGSSNRWQPNAM